MKNILCTGILCLLCISASFAQLKERKEKIKLNGEIVTALITENNDTILIADLEDVSISTPKSFESDEEYRRYLKYRRYAAKVYPYAAKAIRIFRETEHVTQNMKRRERKRHIKRLQRELKKEFKEPLKKLSKTQGKIMIKMIERELDTPFFYLLKGLRGGFTATYWSALSRFYGYRLKRGYKEGEDKILDSVLKDFDISYTADEQE